MPDLPWNLRFVDAPGAWAQMPQRGRAGIHWGALRVAHLDTGYTEHPALGPWEDGRSPQVLVDEGRDFFDPSRGTAFDPLEPVLIQAVGHGTYSGTVLAGNHADPRYDFKGVAPNLPIVPLRVTDQSLLIGRRVTAVAAALRHVAESGVAPVVNVSLGAPKQEKAIREALDACYEAGVIVVCAAGQEIDHVVYPARYGRAISVGGLKEVGSGSRRRWLIYYLYGDYRPVDSWAPAQPIRRGHVERPAGSGGENPWGYFDNADGTTYATVHVAAAAAMWLRLHGRAIEETYGAGWKRVEAFRKLLRDRRHQFSRIHGEERQELGDQWGKTCCLNIAALLRAPLPAVADSDRAEITRRY